MAAVAAAPAVAAAAELCLTSAAIVTPIRTSRYKGRLSGQRGTSGRCRGEAPHHGEITAAAPLAARHLSWRGCLSELLGLGCARLRRSYCQSELAEDCRRLHPRGGLLLMTQIVVGGMLAASLLLHFERDHVVATPRTVLRARAERAHFTFTCSLSFPFHIVGSLTATYRNEIYIDRGHSFSGLNLP